jgi:uncharacterized DUF497 family protein
VKSAFRWNEWNIEYLHRHGIEAEDAEFVIRGSRPPYPESVGEGKRRVMGKTASGVYLQVIYVLDEDDTAYVLHARRLTENEKRRFRRRSK